MLSSDKIEYLLLFIILAVVYNYYLHQEKDDYDKENDKLINDYLLSKGSSKNKTKLWIHVPTEYNSLRWESFGSRSSKDVNTDYLYLCMQSIIKHNKGNDILIITDNSFNKLLPNFSIQLEKLADPVKSKVRKLCLMKLLLKYGGIITPFNLLCNKDLKHMFNEHNNSNPFIVEKVDNSYEGKEYFIPDSNFIGVKKSNHDVIKMFVQFLEQVISSDSTDASNFLNVDNKWCLNEANSGNMNIICGAEVITKTMDGDPILNEQLFENKRLNYNKNAYGLLIPHDEISRRTNYNWLLQMNMNDIKTSDTFICYLLQQYI